MRIEHSFSVKPFTTFGIEANSATFIEVHSIDDLQECRRQKMLCDKNLLVIGGGSNILFCDNYNGVIVRPAMKGISVVEQNEEYAIVDAKAGEVWDDVVAVTVEKGFYGLENLSFIPGNVGACPVQNIGAYGVEVQSAIERVEAFEIATGTICYFNNEECQFAYRDSIFKNDYKDKYIITSVRFKLSCKPLYNIDYKDVNNYLKDESVISLKKIRDAIIAIRVAKLPDPSVVGNAGSFFKNPVVTAQKAKDLKAEFPTIVMYPVANGALKLAAGWLIDYAGWKGFRCGDAGVHPNQALVLINYGNASGKDILNLATEIQNSVMKIFGVVISPEVRIV